MPIDLYYASTSPPCRAVQMVAKHLELELNLIQIDFANGEHLKPEFLEMNPGHSLPTINDGGFILWESRAIMQYLCNKYAPDSDLYPKSPSERAKVDRMLNFDIGSLYKAITEAFYPKFFLGIETPEDKMKALKEKLNLLDVYIGDKNYVACDYLTIADLSIFEACTVFTVAEYDLSPYQRVNEWYERLITELPYAEEINNEDVRKLFIEFSDKMIKMNASKLNK